MELIPPVPEDLRAAAQRGALVPFIGAGVSRLAGCPSWEGFADGALNQFVQAGKLSYAHLEQVKSLPARVRLSIALSLQSDKELDIDFKKLIHATPIEKCESGLKIYAHLSKIGKQFVTTNYDSWLDNEIVLPELALVEGMSSQPNRPKFTSRKSFFRTDELTFENLNTPSSVIHLHGSLEEPEGMVMTTQQYMRHYANDRSQSLSSENRVLTFLDHLFRDKTVLFIGYGLNELEILEYVMLKARRVPKGPKFESARHYLIDGFFSHQTELVNYLSRYYFEECGIQLIPFLRDANDYLQLESVLESFALQLQASGPTIVQQFFEMDNLING